MASDGTRVFVLGGISSAIAQTDALIHVLDISTYFIFDMSFGQPSSLKTQSTSRTRILTPALSSLVRRPLSHPRDPQPKSNHNTRRPLHRMLARHTVPLLFQKLPRRNRVALPPRISRASETTAETPFRMTCHRTPRV
jgi:hypothetical protein